MPTRRVQSSANPARASVSALPSARSDRNEVRPSVPGTGERSERFAAAAKFRCSALLQSRAREPLMRFAALHLSARKFPAACQMCVLKPPRDEKFAVLFDDGGDHDDSFSHSSWIFLRGSSCFLVFRVMRIRLAERCHRAYQALRFSRRAQHGAEVHQRLIEIEDTTLRNQRGRDAPQAAFSWRGLLVRHGRRTHGTIRGRRWYREWPLVLGTRSCGWLRPYTPRCL